MIRSILVYLAFVLLFAKPSTSPFFAVSYNTQIPRLVAFEDLISVIKNLQVNYVYFDISSSDSSINHRTILKELAKSALPTFIKHISVVNSKQLQQLEQSLVNFNQSNTYTIQNISNIGKNRGKVLIDENLLTSEILKSVDSNSLILLNFHQAIRLLQETNQTSTSPMLSVMTPSALSGLFVAGFLLTVLLIAVSCLMDLKTNDRFPRTLLNVGKES